MKKMIFVLFSCFALLQNANSQRSVFGAPMDYAKYKEYACEGFYELDLDDLFRRVEKFVAIDDKYNLTVKFKDTSTGDMILKGSYNVERGSELTCLSYEMARCKIYFTIKVQKEGDYSWHEWIFDEVKVNFTGTYGSSYSHISTSTLEKIYDELRVIENNKSSFVIDSTYFNHIEELKTKIEGYKAIANDETLKKKERRSAEYSLQKYTTEKNVYEGVLEIVRYFMFMFNANAFKR